MLIANYEYIGFPIVNGFVDFSNGKTDRLFIKLIMVLQNFVIMP